MIDYKDYAQQAIAVLKMLPDAGYMMNVGTVSLSSTLINKWDCDHEMAEAPLPEWAESYNEYREIKERAQLCTKDGRRCGNARVIRLVTKEQCGMSNDYWFVRTDVGTTMHLLTEEVNEMFHIGDYIMKETN